MRYPRLLIVWFVALGLAASPTAVARADHTGARSGEFAYAGSVFDMVGQTVLGGDPVRRSDAVGVLSDATQIDNAQAGRLLDAVAGRVLVIADAGQRAGVLAIPQVNGLIAELLGSPRTAGGPPETADTGEPWNQVGNAALDREPAAPVPVGEPFEAPAADPVERWRPLVERYFGSDLVDEALLIIDCESSGDPEITNPRSSAAGLFQFISGTWEYASEQAGFAGASAFDPEANVASAAWLVGYSLDAGRSAWAHWTCRP
jgi:hypothetical protein